MRMPRLANKNSLLLVDLETKLIHLFMKQVDQSSIRQKAFYRLQKRTNMYLNPNVFDL